MKLKIAFSNELIFRYLYVLLIVVNMVACFYLFVFLKHYVYGAYVIDQDEVDMLSARSSGDINLEKFDEIIEGIRIKSTH